MYFFKTNFATPFKDKQSLIIKKEEAEMTINEMSKKALKTPPEL